MIPKNAKRISRLARNLQPGDLYIITDMTGPKITKHVVKVITVRETLKAWFSGRRQWQINYEIQSDTGYCPFTQDGFGASLIYSTDRWRVYRS